MTTLLHNCTTIYQQRPDFNKYYDIENFYPLFRKYLLDTVRQRHMYIRASDISEEYGINLSFLNEFLLLFSKNKLGLSKYYYLECLNCNQYNIQKNLHSLASCIHCSYNFTEDDLMYMSSHIEFCYKINTSLYRSLLEDLNYSTPFQMDLKSENIDKSTDLTTEYDKETSCILDNLKQLFETKGSK